MLNKKLVFSLVTIPAAVLFHDAGEWQKRRASEKNKEIARRLNELNSEAIDISPTNGQFPFSGKTSEEIEAEYGFKKVTINGIIDFEKETFVDTVWEGEKGYHIINPLYTHVNEKNEPCGILVNRGFLPKDFITQREQHAAPSSGTFEGVLYTGDNLGKYDDHPNAPIKDHWTKVLPKQLALKYGLKNREDADVAMLKLVEFDVEHQTVMPNAPTIEALTRWKNPAERHTAYQSFWKYTTYFNLFANTMFWLYF